MTVATTELLLRVNGIQAAFGIELGFDSPRANEGRSTDPYRQANASFSLVQKRGGEIVRHTLIDVGMGVVPSLLEFEHTHNVHVINEVFITHPHFDHFAQLDWLSMALLRNTRQDQPRPLPIYASPLCWENGPNRVFRHLAERSDYRALQAGTAVILGDLKLTPFAVDHNQSAPGAMGFVVEHADRKVIITGDFLRIPNEDNPLFFGADVAFLDANTWHPAERTGHQSVLGNLRLIKKWQPKRTYIVHYSGYEDREHPDDPVNGPMEFGRLRDELRRVAAPYDVQPARHGMILSKTAEDQEWYEA
jgi:phosphoribosyl 1,2-cyclic phosphodiesterase